MTEALRTDPALPAESPSGDPRADRVAAAVKTWQRTLVDLGGRNTLLWYRDLPSGTLDLTTAHPGGVSMLLAGRPTRLSDLVREPAALEEARRRARAIRSKTLELREERGIAAGFIAIGMATWSVPARGTPAGLAGPAALLRAAPDRRGAGGLRDRPRARGRVQPGARATTCAPSRASSIDADALADLATAGNGFDPYPVYAALGHACARRARVRRSRPGSSSAPSPTPSCRWSPTSPLQGDTLADHDVVAALAGDESALARGAAPGAGVSDPDPDPDARATSSSTPTPRQQAAIDAVRAGAHLVIKGPPGTGKSQTIANLIAALAGRGQVDALRRREAGRHRRRR